METFFLNILSILTSISLTLASAVANPVVKNMANPTNSFGDGSGLVFSVNKSGINSMIYNGEVLINTPSWRNLNEVGWQNIYLGCKTWLDNNSNKSTNCSNTEISRTLEGSNKVIMNHSWGKVEAEHILKDSDTLEIDVSVTNNDPKTMIGFSMNFLNSLFYNTEVFSSMSDKQSFDVQNGTPESPAAGYIKYGNGAFAFWTDIVDKTTRINAAPHHNDSYLTSINIGGNQFNTLPQFYISIPTGQSYRFKVWYKFGSANTDKSILMKPGVEAFTKVYPFSLNWPDRRPIMMGMYSSHYHQSATNPRGWFNEPTKDYVSSGGIDRFKKDLDSAADRTVAALRESNAQGIIFWNMEGEMFPHAITYIGDPRRLSELAPEMDAAIDGFVKKIKDAGFKIGFTLRPQELNISNNTPTGSCTEDDIVIKTNEPIDPSTIWRKWAFMCKNGVWNQGGLPYFQPPNKNAAETLIDKIAYAKNRWGASMFYVDSNGGNIIGGGPDPAYVFAEVYSAHPDVLVIPELETPRYFAYTAAYNELDLGWTHSPSWAKSVYPNAFSVINVSDGLNSSNFQNLVDSVRGGNILMARGWFIDSSTIKVKEIYAAAGAPKQISPDLNNDGVVNSLDFSLLNRKLNQIFDAFDLNGDGQINASDILILKAGWFK